MFLNYDKFAPFCIALMNKFVYEKCNNCQIAENMNTITLLYIIFIQVAIEDLYANNSLYDMLWHCVTCMCLFVLFRAALYSLCLYMFDYCCFQT